jgi:hypothetical protein
MFERGGLFRITEILVMRTGTKFQSLHHDAFFGARHAPG